MNSDKKTGKGGFVAILALIISIVALILAFVAFQRTGGQADLDNQISELQTKIEKIKQETTERMDKVRQETKKVLEKVGIEIKKETNTE